MSDGIFIFRRDFRIKDNTSLIELSKKAQNIYPIFIFTPGQIGKRNRFRSNNAIQFMVESLKSLYQESGKKLTFYYGENDSIISRLLRSNPNIGFIGYNRDYTPYSKKRDTKIERIAKRNNVEVVSVDDYTIVPMTEIRDNSFFSVFKAFYNRMMKIKPPKPDNSRPKLSRGLKGPKPSGSAFLDRIYKENKELIVRGGRKQGLAKLSNLKKFKNYAKIRNLPQYDTTLLSAYIKFGCISMREAYQAMIKHTGKNSELTRQLIWHDFYANLMNYLPQKRTIGGGNFKNKKIKWRKNIKHQRAWEEGRTGFPMVDAGMRQINTVGWMHNRSRLIVSNFLSLILHQDWHIGEKYFAQHLVDYDVSSNNGNWQWSTGVGTDKTGYLRIYNPFNQSKELDKNCVYIKKWIPELRKVPNQDIHNWDKHYEEYEESGYPGPIVDLAKEMKISKKMY